MPADAAWASPAKSRLFRDLPASARGQILGAARRCSLRKGQQLIRQGDVALSFFLIDQGYLKLTQVTPDGREVIVRFVGPGDPVAGVTAAGDGMYPVTATACDRADFCEWPRAVLVRLLTRYPQLKTNLLWEMTAHMDDALLRLRELATMKVGQRLAHTLLRLSRPSSPSAPGAGSVPHALTRQELAELTGTTLFTVSRILTGWEAAGLIRSTRAHVEITDRQALRDVADADA